MGCRAIAKRLSGALRSTPKASLFSRSFAHRFTVRAASAAGAGGASGAAGAALLSLLLGAATEDSVVEGPPPLDVGEAAGGVEATGGECVGDILPQTPRNTRTTMKKLSENHRHT